MNGQRYLIAGCVATQCLLATVGTLAANEKLGLDGRVRYQARIDRIYSQARSSAPDAVATDTESVSLSGPRAAVEAHLKMADALRSKWGVEVTQADIQAEYERILEHSADRERLQALFRALDNDGQG